ncbi:Zinc finger domain-containing protein, CCHC-type [Cordyceps militaris CM01]|uniref:Zinc finger domain-containing protein, CCHC-type n=1 Tax=Cordyceps militaris (strain CM01) TaxID=983644 RepID=G3JAW8_CORMM|nr:Zinc finger domain-containing protein, CCHC-type [Cordyceps militaris CM01]EGX94381.1 Zinc finger domain-containing protein, CCHC-type [Cordyceps militaris CM01]
MAPDTPKGVSSRLLTMKFMQRAIASNSAPASPDSEPKSAKKRKLDHGSPAGRLSMDFDQASVDAAMQAQEAKRKAALLQHATGDTHWVLNTKFEKPATAKASKISRKIVYVGYGDMDSENDSGDAGDVAANGRTSTRKPKPKTESSQHPSDDESGDETGQDSDGSDRPNRRKRKESGSQRDQSRSRSKSRTRPSAADTKAKELRDKRRKKEVRLNNNNNNITSISGSGDNSLKNKPSMTCYNCHQPGHRVSDCPRRKPGGRSK